MKWYGLSKYSENSIFKNKKLSFHRRTNKNSIFFNNSIKLNFSNFNFYLPSNWNFLIIKKKFFNLIVIYIYSDFYFFTLPLSNKYLSLRYDPQVNFLFFKCLIKNNFYSLFWNFFKIIFYSFSKIFFKKLKFKGKGFYIYKNFRNTKALQFGYSHRVYLYTFFINVKFLTKTTIFIFGLNKLDLITSSNNLYNIKTINVFTGKGIRFSRQIIYRKTGKVSSYR